MDKAILQKVKDIINRIEKVNNRTENKIDVLKDILIEYHQLSEKYNHFNSYPVAQLIQDIDLAKTKRKNVSKKSIHHDFSRIKDDALFKIRHTHGILEFKANEESNKQ